MAFTGPVAKATTQILLEDLVSFAVANAGFTDEGAISSGAPGHTDLFRISKGGMYWWFNGTTASISGYGTIGVIQCRMGKFLPTVATMFTAGDAQQYYCEMTTWSVTTGPYIAANMFSDGTNVFLALETLSGVYSHLAFGKITKFGSWTGGEYLTAHCQRYYNVTSGWSEVTQANFLFEAGTGNPITQSQVIYYPINSYGDYRDYWRVGNAFSADSERNHKMQVLPYTRLTDSFTSYYTRYCINGAIQWASPCNIGGRAPIGPMYVQVPEPIVNAYYTIGLIENVGVVRVDNLNAGDIVDVDWQVFPAVRKSGDDFTSPITQGVGYAFKRIA